VRREKPAAASEKNGASLLDDDQQARAKFALPSRHSRNVTHATLTRVRRPFWRDAARFPHLFALPSLRSGSSFLYGTARKRLLLVLQRRLRMLLAPPFGAKER